MSALRNARSRAGLGLDGLIARVPLVGLIALGGAGCFSHIAPYAEKHRTFESADCPDLARPAGGSLFAAGYRGLIEDDRASRVCDLVVITVDESISASHDTVTKLDKTDKSGLGLTGAIATALGKAVPGADLSSILGTSSNSNFAGGGTIQRKGSLVATLPVRVQKVLSNGDFIVEGTKVVKVGSEESYIYVSGIIRRADVRGDNTVPSSRVADAQFEYIGRGDLTDSSQPSWLKKLLNKVSPL